MSLDLDELKKLHDKAYVAAQVTRENASDDLVFYWVTQWDDNILNETQLAYRGEFNILRKAGRQIMSDLYTNPIQIDFYPKDEKRNDSSELIDGLYRADDNNNQTQESYDYGKQDAVVCGFGAWELYTEYKSISGNDNKQVIKRRPIHEANNVALCDPNAKLIDKSDAKYWSILTAYTEEGYKELVEELTGEEPESMSTDSFKHPQHSYVFPWTLGESKKIYVVTFYHKEKVTVKVFTMKDIFGETMDITEDNLEEIMDDLLDEGWTIEGEDEVERYQVTKYIASGQDIFSEEVIVGQHIPVVPIYGEHAWIEGEEHYEGVTRLAKDPQRLRNFQMSYLADIVSQSPRLKPIFYPEQIKSFEYMYNITGIDNNFPYLLQNKVDLSGMDLPLGPVATMPEQTIPQALIASIELTKSAVEDVANPGLPQDIADPDVSGKAILALQARLDMQSLVYQKNFKYAKQYDARVYKSIAAEIYDTPRRERILRPDGTEKYIDVRKSVIDKDTGDVVIINDIFNKEFDVLTKMGPDHATQKEQTIDRLEKLAQGIDATDPMRKILQLKILKLTDGVDFDDIRDYANMQLVTMGVRKPETPEEQQKLKEAQEKAKEPSPEMVLAKAEDKKGQAALLKEQREGILMNFEVQNEQAKRQIDVFEAQTDRMEVQVDAQETGADINMKNIKAFGEHLDNTAKVYQLPHLKKMDKEIKLGFG